VGINAGGVAFQAQGFAAPLRDTISHKKWLSIWRGKKERQICVRDSHNSDSREPRVEILRDLDDKIFETAKYRNGTSEYLTVLTYTEELLGAISLFEAVLDDKMHVATRLDLIATMPDVPQNILRQLRQQVTPNRIDLRYKGRKLRRRNASREDLPFQWTVRTESGEKWSRSGWGWRKSLRLIDRDDENKCEGLVASIPQMMAFLHLQNKYLTDVRSTPVFPSRIP
jgi:hypothetical protein